MIRFHHGVPPFENCSKRRNMHKALLFLVLSLFVFQCNSTLPSGDKPVVTVSVLPQLYFLEELAGDLVEVNVMVPPGASPASYEPDLKQMALLEQSALYLNIGSLGFEQAWLQKIRDLYPELRMVSLAESIDQIPQQADDHARQDPGQHNRENPAHEHDGHAHEHGSLDPHIWMSARNGRIIARDVASALNELLPEQHALIGQRLRKLDSSLQQLDLEIENRLASLEQRSFMIYHPALGYFARDYQLKQHALESEGRAPSVAHMQDMVNLGRKEGIRTVFIQSQFDRANAETLARSLNAKVVQIDPLATDWPSQLKLLSTNLIKAAE